ncbi:MAG: histidine phosphatase family protein [Clostridia bacterium]|nr:histidine phosphatase family protein [Clostridia bacterium]
MQRIHLIRHGATVAEEQNLYCGKSDLPLSPGGLDGLHRLAAGGGYPAGEGCRRITSGAQRAEQTLEALYGKGEHEVLPAFREIDYGAFELQSYGQLKSREDYQLWAAGGPSARCPGGESGEDVANRVHPAFAALLEDGRDAIVVTHGGVIAAIMTDLYPDSMAGRQDWQGEPGHGWSVTFDGGKPVKCEPIPDPFLNQEKVLGKKWAWVSMGFLAGALGGVLMAAYSAMNGTHREPLWFAAAAVLLVISQTVRFKKLRCPYCGKSVAPLKFIGSPKLACPRCGRIYRYEE